MKKLKPKFILCILLPIQWIIYSLASQHENFIENIYFNFIFKNLSQFLRFITGWFTLSLGLLLLYLLALFLLYKIVKMCIEIIKKKLKLKDFLLNITSTFSALYGIYMITWGLAYYRKPFAENTKVDTNNISSNEIKKLAEILIYNTNQSRKKLSYNNTQNQDIEKYFAKAANGFTKISKQYPELEYVIPSIKIGFNKAILSYLSTGGIYAFVSGEANINANNSAFEAPFTICHEMAHQLGFASEEEANYISFLTCMHNSEPIFQYSAYSEAMVYTLNNIYPQDSTLYNKLKASIDTAVLNDIAYAKAKWEPYQIPWLKNISSHVYDIFLKSNSQNAGIKSYGLVVELLVGEMRKNKNYLQIKPNNKI